MPSTPLQIRTWDDLPAGIVAAEQAGSLGLAHLMRALRAGRIAFLPLMPECSNARFRQFSAATRNRPAVVLVPDDDYRNRGPSGWAAAERAVQWAVRIIVHAAGAELLHYEGAIEAAQTERRALLIECGTATAHAWIDLTKQARKRLPDLLIWPKHGVHPIIPAAERLQ